MCIRDSSSRYRTQKRGGKGLRDIKTTDRNGKVIGIKQVNDDDELLLMTSRGKIQRIKCGDVSVIGRNTQGVRIMGLDDEDSLAVIARVPRDELGDDDEASPTDPADDSNPTASADSGSDSPTAAGEQEDAAESKEEADSSGDSADSDSE